MFAGFRKSYHQQRYSKVKKLIGNDAMVLDIGCGRPCETMEDLSFVRYLGRGVGVDVKKIREKDFVRAKAESLPFKRQTFDCVVAMEILEHLENPAESLKDMREVVKDGGTVIVTTPNNNLLWKTVWYFWVRFVGRMWKDEHKSNLDKRDWVNLVGKHYEVVDVLDHWGVNVIIYARKKNGS